MRPNVRAAIDRYFKSIPGADAADLHDPTYHAQFTRMARFLETMDMAMEDEGIPEASRTRVVRTVLYGAPDESAALERVEAREKLVHQFAAGPRASYYPWGWSA